MLGCWDAGIKDNAGMLEFWNSGMLEFWHAGILACWNSGMLEFRR